MDAAQVEREVLEFIQKQFLFGKKSVGLKDALLTSGGLDSVAHLKLISHIEKKYGVQVSIEDFDPENFDTVEKIARFIAKKRKSASASR